MKTKFFLLLFAYMASSMIFATDVFDFTTMNLSQSDLAITNGSVSYNSSKGYYEVSNNANDTLSMTINGVPNVVFKYWAETSKKAFKVKSNEYIQLDGATRTLRITNLNINDIVTLRVASKGPSAANSFSGGLTNCTLESGNLTQAEYDYPFVYEDVSFKATASTIEITNTAGGYCLTTISIERSQSSDPQHSGTCGPNLTWTLQDSVLTISGTGNMNDYSLNDSPWYSYRQSITSVAIGNSVTSIGNYAFHQCSGLTSVTIPNSVTSIGRSAFNGCSGLTSVTIPNSVTSIGSSAFSGCSGLTSITIPNSVTSIGDAAFYHCSGLTSVTIPNSVTSIGSGTFSGCSGLTSVTIPNSVTSIGNGAFYRCSGLTSVNIGNSVTSIGEYAFYSCSGLTSVTIGNSVTSIEHGAFYGCSGLTSVTIESNNIVGKAYSSSNNLSIIFGSQVTEYIIGDSVTSIGVYAFYSCSALTSVTIPNSVTSIGDYAFYGCSGLTSITIPNSVTSIGGSAFDGCSGLTSITIPNSVTSIGEYAFYYCSGLTSVTIPNSVTSIGNQAFYYCSGLTSVTIPNSVTSIGDEAFRGCSGLQTIYLKSSTPSQLEYDVFGNTGLTNIYVPCGALNTYQNAEGWSSYASYIKNEPSIIQGVPLVEGTGSVNIPQTICEDTIEAIPAYGYHFVQWTDGNTDNPRVIDPLIEATYIAEFELEKSGRCGDDLLLRWAYDSESQTLTISGNGTFNSNIQYGVEAPLEMTSLIIEDSVQSIGASAFAGISTLTSVTLGQDVSRIRENAFYDCENLTVIRNYRPTPATVYSNTFDGVDKFTCTLYVPEGSVAMYSAATGWRDFYSIVGFNPTGHENLSEDASAIRKVFIDGHLYISLPDGTRYDATGKKVE